MITKTTVLLSPKGRVKFPSVYVPTAFEEGDDPKYSTILVFYPSDMDDQQKSLYEKIRADVDSMSVDVFGVKTFQRDEDGTIINSPFRLGEEKPKYYDPGTVFARFANQYKPNVVDAGRNPIPEDSGDFYPGCWAHVSFTCWTYNYKGNKGVSLSLGNIQKTGDDEPFAGRRTSVSDDFDILEAPAANTEANEIPF